MSLFYRFTEDNCLQQVSDFIKATKGTDLNIMTVNVTLFAVEFHLKFEHGYTKVKVPFNSVLLIDTEDGKYDIYDTSEFMQLNRTSREQIEYEYGVVNVTVDSRVPEAPFFTDSTKG